MGGVLRGMSAGAVLAAAALALGGCGSGFQVREALGVDKNPPDAFAISTTRKLEAPPDYVNLPPPTPGAASRLENDPRTAARAALGVAPSTALAGASSAAPSAAETALLAGAGATAPAAPVDLASVAPAAEPDYLLDRWFPFLKRMRGERKGQVVDPLAEMARLGTTPPATTTAVATTPSLLIPPSASQ